MWTYDGQFPGPTLEVRRDRLLRVAWTNGIEGTMPLVAVQVPFDPTEVQRPGYRKPDGSPLDGASIINGVADLPPWSVTHLHGARTGGGDDGWSHNGVPKGGAQLAEYPNAQRATTLWYHDHAMAITRFVVHAGLLGMYLIRDDEEDALGLPHGDREVPLILCDRNLDQASSGQLTGQLLFKVGYLPDGALVPFFGPFTLVNGVIWPHLEVATSWYRFRVVNASNFRAYTLDLVDESGTSQRSAVRQIGTDGGLLPRPVQLSVRGLTLVPGERADLLVDFSGFAGRRLRLRNIASTPFPTPEPDIMEFRVDEKCEPESFTLPQTLSDSYIRLQHGSTLPAQHEHVYVVFVPPGTAGDGHPQMWELAEVANPAELPTSYPAEGYIQLTERGTIRTFRRVASLFDDGTTFFFKHGSWVVWNLINLGAPAHPMHIHLAQFQALSRRAYLLNSNGNVVGFDITSGGTSGPLSEPGPGRPLDPYEEGWKDTYLLDPGEWLTVAGEFSGGTGSFMYHCHILDHEDEGMMRPFVVHPPQVAAFHVSHGGHGQHH